MSTRIKQSNCKKLAVLTVLVATLSAGVAFATDSYGITQVAVSIALYEGIDITAQRQGVEGPGWRAKLKVTGFSDVAVTSNTAIPGAYSGWHSHPGLVIVSVTQGALSLYDADDPTCTATVVTAGNGFVEAGDHVHIVRNEGTVDAKWTTTAIRPAGAAARIDQPAPDNCRF